MINLYDLGCYDMKKHLTLLSLLALAGCSAFEQNSDGIAYSHKDIPLQKNQLQANDGNAVIADSNGEFIASGNILKHPPNRVEQHNLKINGAKMRVDKLPISMGSRIFDMRINSWGIIKGSLTVVMHVGYSINQLDQVGIFNLKKLAVDTYQLLPIGKSIHLYEVYKNLLNNPLVKVVELDIFYDGMAPTQDM